MAGKKRKGKSKGEKENPASASIKPLIGEPVGFFAGEMPADYRPDPERGEEDLGSDGIHRFVSVSWQAPEDRRRLRPLAALLGIPSHQMKNPMDELWAIYNACDAVLEAEGFPLAWERVDWAGPEWWRRSDPDAEEKRARLVGLGHRDYGGFAFHAVQDIAETFSNAWYAARVSELLGSVLRVYRGSVPSTPDQPFFNGYDLHRMARVGQLLTEWQWRLEQRPDILRGKKVHRAASEGGKSRTRGPSDTTRAVLDFMRQQVAAGLSIAEAARRAHRKNLGNSPDANERLWRRYHPKPKKG